MKQYLHILVLLVLGTSSAFGQAVSKADIRGVIVDENSAPLNAATIMLLQASDSVLTSFGTSNEQGVFELRKVKAGDYLLQVTYLGYNLLSQDVHVGDSEVIDMGSIALEPASEVLGEVEVTADHIPIRITKDTIEYNSDAFQTQPNQVVEDLLKKLPGVEVDKDGNVQAQGEDVQNVLVDGKEFFGSDPKMATKNLPADAVDKVQVYDRMSDMAEFSGIDDGERQKTINLKLKEDKKKGVFGTVEAGYGTDEHYNAKASINRFTKSSQLSFLGMGNNINEQGFSVNEYLNFAGGMSALASGGGRIRLGGRDQTVPISNGLSDGLARTLAGGVNYNVDIGKKFELRTNYFYNNIDNTISQDAYRQNFVGETYETNSTSESNTESQGHRVNLIAEYDLDSTQNIELRSSLSLSDGSSMQIDSSISSLNQGEDRRNASLTDYASESDRYNLTGELYYRKRFGEKRGRVLTANLGMNSTNTSSDGTLMSINEFFQTGRYDLIDQLQNQTGQFNEWHTRLSYTEPIGKNKWLEANYRYEKNDDDSDKDIYDVDPGSGLPVLNDTLSVAYTRDFSYHRAGFTFRWNTIKSSLSVGLQYQGSDLTGFVNSSENRIDKDFRNLLPSLSYRYEFASARSLRFEYNTRIDVPDVDQLSPIVDNSDPLRIYLGNPNLKAEYVHSARLGFHSFSQFSSTAIFGMLRATYTENQIINAKSIDTNLVEISIPRNIDGQLNLSAFGSFSRPVNFIKSRIRLDGRLSYTNSKIYINIADGMGVDFQESSYDRWSETIGISFQSLNSDVYTYDVGGKWTFNNTFYELEGQTDQSFFTQNYYAEFGLTFLKNWNIRTEFDVNIYSGDGFSDTQTLPLWSASLSRYILKDKKGEIKLSCFDILNKNRGISRVSNSNYLEEVNSNSLGQYFMLSFIYSIKGFAQGAAPDVHITRRRH